MTITGPDLERRRMTPFWLLLVAGSVITSLSLGVRSTFGLFLDPVVETIGSGRGAFAFAIAVRSPTGTARPGCSVAARWPTPRDSS